MESIKYEDRVFELECGSCKALLKYKSHDIQSKSAIERIDRNEYLDGGKVRFYFEDIRVINKYIICPICGCEHLLYRLKDFD